jgi:hypothetical protein
LVKSWLFTLCVIVILSEEKYETAVLKYYNIKTCGECKFSFDSSLTSALDAVSAQHYTPDDLLSVAKAQGARWALCSVWVLGKDGNSYFYWEIYSTAPAYETLFKMLLPMFAAARIRNTV